MAQEVGVREVLEHLRDRLNSMDNRLDRIEGRLDSKADKWEVRIWFMTVLASQAALAGLLGAIIARLP